MPHSPQTLIDTAHSLVGKFSLVKEELTAGVVASALLTQDGNVYTGINLDFYCGIGFCAEHSAIAEMLKHRETKIQMIVAVDQHRVLPPCGRCRELMHQVDVDNRKNTQVILAPDRIVLLEELLPDYWMDAKSSHLTYLSQK